jgi:hypothetical protein
MRSTISFPFQLGEHRRIAVKVIDFRGERGGAGGKLAKLQNREMFEEVK